jgi:hypothetical protein
MYGLAKKKSGPESLLIRFVSDENIPTYSP